MFCLKVFLLLVTTLKADTTLKAYKIHSKKTNWVNSYHGRMDWHNYKSDNNEMATGFYSVYDNRKEDRIWKFYYGVTSSSGKTVTCKSPSYNYLSEGLNLWDGPVSYVCPSNHAINGFGSRHSNRHKDRVWRVGCCKVTGARLVDDGLTSYLNSWNGVLDFTCEDDEVLIGVDSVHANHYEDRRWKALCARLVFDEGVTFSSKWTGWMNAFDGRFAFSPRYPNIVITGLYSVHDNSKEDRRWKIKYGNTLREGNSIARSGHYCFPARRWTGDRNTFGGELSFTCGKNGLLHGINSFLDDRNRFEDRRWSFKCCQARGYSVRQLEWTGYLNSWNRELSYSCPDTDQAIVGVASVYDNGQGDRRWKVRCGRLIKRRTLR